MTIVQKIHFNVRVMETGTDLCAVAIVLVHNWYLIFFFHWHYSPLWVLACRTMSFNFFLSATNSLHLLTPSTWKSLPTSSFHLFLGLPLLLIPSSSWVKIFLFILSFSILSRWPNQLILFPFIHFTIFSPLLISSSSIFVRLFCSLFSYLGMSYITEPIIATRTYVLTLNLVLNMLSAFLLSWSPILICLIFILYLCLPDVFPGVSNLFFTTDDMVCWSMTHIQICGCFIHCYTAIFLHDGFNCCNGPWCHYSVCLTRSRRVRYRTNAVHELPSPLVHLQQWQTCITIMNFHLSMNFNEFHPFTT